jgi:hypothetical protein
MCSDLSEELFYLQHGNVFAVPIVHYNMEMAACVRRAFEVIRPDCVAVELAETAQLQLLHAASRLPDISVVTSYDEQQQPTYYLAEPCDASFEALRSALENKIPGFCIDLDVANYPDHRDQLPDPYAVQRIGLKNYYQAYEQLILGKGTAKASLDHARELYMAQRLKELSFSYECILFVGGMYHVRDVLKAIDRPTFAKQVHIARPHIEIATLTEEACRECMAEAGWISRYYEEGRAEAKQGAFFPDRQKLIYHLYKQSGGAYQESTGNDFPGYHMRNLMKFVRNYALIHARLMPDLFQIVTAAKGCVDHNYAYEVWLKGTDYPYRRNVDSLQELSLTIEQIWGHSKRIRFHLKAPSRKAFGFRRRSKDRSKFRFEPPGPFTLCSYPPEDTIVERFGDFLKKKGTQILTEDAARTVVFSTSLEDGIDTRETIRHWHEKKLYVKMKGKPPGGVGSLVVIFDEDKPKEDMIFREQYPWKTTWLGEHTQESDMAFYATQIRDNVVGPGISRCEYGGFMMSYPPRRLFDVWHDPDYGDCRTKAEVLLMAAIDYAVQPLVVYVANAPPRSLLKSFARRFGKKVVYVPLAQLSPILLNKIRAFHVLDGHDRREGADEYIDN